MKSQVEVLVARVKFLEHQVDRAERGLLIGIAAIVLLTVLVFLNG